ncbi:hypothetical protein V6Z12_A11G184600 [Gossypium hirsutum]
MVQIIFNLENSIFTSITLLFMTPAYISITYLLSQMPNHQTCKISPMHLIKTLNLLFFSSSEPIRSGIFIANYIALTLLIFLNQPCLTPISSAYSDMIITL